jgi:EmrB/QacA subfamily drug resistance transporter
MSDFKRNSYRNSILFVICLATVMVPFMGSALNLALPVIAREFSMNAISLSWVVTVFLLVSAIFPVPFSRLGDIIGRKKVYAAGVIIFTISSLFGGLATSGLFLILARLFQGVGASMIFATNMAILTSVFPANERGKALGINTAVVYISISLGPFIGGMLTHYLGWRSIFIVTTFIGLLSIAGIFLIMKGEWIESKGEKFDWKGVLFYGTGIASLIYGFSSLPMIIGFIFILIGIVSLIVFVNFEKKIRFPVINVRLFWENKIFGLASSAAMINYAATFSISFLLSLYLQYIKGLNAQHAGLILIVQPVVQGLISPFAGRWSDKIDARNLATSGMACILTGLFLLFFLGPGTPTMAIIAITTLLGIGFGLFSSPNVNIIMGSVEPRYLGMASATTNTVRLTGQAFSMGITMMIISIIVGKVKITPDVFPDFMHSIHIIFIILAVLCSIGVYTSWKAKKQDII